MACYGIVVKMALTTCAREILSYPWACWWGFMVRVGCMTSRMQDVLLSGGHSCSNPMLPCPMVRASSVASVRLVPWCAQVRQTSPLQAMVSCSVPSRACDVYIKIWVLRLSQDTKVAVAQLAARRSHNPKVVSSILTCHKTCFGFAMFHCKIKCTANGRAAA